VNIKWKSCTNLLLEMLIEGAERFSNVCDYYDKVCTKGGTSLYLPTNMITYDALHNLCMLQGLIL